MSLVLNVEILGEFKKLTAATQGAQSDLQNMSKKAAGVSKSINRAFAAIGIGLSFRVLANELEDAAKAAIDDVKSQELLALAMTNTGQATDKTIASAEDYIKKMQFTAGVADDKLRPAYQKLFIATGDVTKSNHLLSIALDAAAATGKDLDVVTQAMAKSLAGSDTALVKLIPSLKGSKTPIEDMGKAFEGAAAKAANLDPYQRMTIVFQDLQEQVGMALLPILEKFSAWVASPEGQAKLQGLITLISDLAGKFDVLAGWAIDNADALVAWSGVIAVVGIGLKAFTTIVSVYNGISAIMTARSTAAALATEAVGDAALVANGKLAIFNTTAGITARILGTVAAVLLLGGDAPNTNSHNNPNTPTQPNAPALTPIAPSTPTDTSGGAIKYFRGSMVQPTQVNVTINTPKVDAEDIINTINNYTRNGGVAALR